MPSLRDIARELDVSISLVSKVLNDRLGTTGVRPELITSIRATADRIGYRKNFSALSLLARRQNAIAVFIHSHGSRGSGLIERLLEGITEAVRDRRLRILLEFFDTAEAFRNRREDLHVGMVDGLLLAGAAHPDLHDDLLELRAEGLPVITLYNDPVGTSIPNIGASHQHLADAATSHLIERGCREILHFSVLEDREEGYRRALKRADIPVREDLIISFANETARTTGTSSMHPGFAAEAGREGIRRALAKGIRFDGVSCQSDAQGSAALNELIRSGVRVPEDVKIIGIDNAPFGELCIVPLSSVAQRFEARGSEGVAAIERMVAGETVTSSTLEPILHARESTAL